MLDALATLIRTLTFHKWKECLDLHNEQLGEDLMDAFTLLIFGAFDLDVLSERGGESLLSSSARIRISRNLLNVLKDGRLSLSLNLKFHAFCITGSSFCWTIHISKSF